MRGTRALAVAAVAAVAASACGVLDMSPLAEERVGPTIELGPVRTFGGDGEPGQIFVQALRGGGWCIEMPDGAGGCSMGDVDFGPSGVNGWGASSGGGTSCFNAEASPSVHTIRVETDGQTVTLPPLERSLEVLDHHVFAACFVWDVDWEAAVLTALHDDGSEHQL